MRGKGPRKRKAGASAEESSQGTRSGHAAQAGSRLQVVLARAAGVPWLRRGSGGPTEAALGPTQTRISQPETGDPRRDAAGHLRHALDPRHQPRGCADGVRSRRYAHQVEDDAGEEAALVRRATMARDTVVCARASRRQHRHKAPVAGAQAARAPVQRRMRGSGAGAGRALQRFFLRRGAHLGRGGLDNHLGAGERASGHHFSGSGGCFWVRPACDGQIRTTQRKIFSADRTK